MIFEKVRNIIVDSLSCNVEDVTLEANLADDLGLDSLDAVELNLAMEEAFEISIPDEALLEFKTVGNIVDYISSQV